MRKGGFLVLLGICVLLLSGSAAALDVNSSKSLQYFSGGNLNFEVGTSGQVTVQGDVDMGSGRLNNISNFFQDNCASDEAVTRVFANGTYSCEAISDLGGGTEDLESTLGAGFSAGSHNISLNGNMIDEVGAINMQNPLADGNISNAITIGSSGSVDKGALSSSGTLGFDWGDGEVVNSLTVGSTGSVDDRALTNGGTLGFDWQDNEVVDALTVSSSGSVDTGALSGVVSNDIDTGHFTTSDPLADGNISDGISVTASAGGSVDKGTLVDTGTLSFDWQDGEVSNALTIGSSGSVDKGALSNSGTLSFDWQDGEVSDALNISSAGNVSIVALHQGGASSGQVLEWDGSNWVPAADDSSGVDYAAVLNVSGDQMAGTLNMNSFDIDNVRAIDMQNALTDGNVSDTITIGSGGSVDTGALSGTVTNDVDTAFLTTSDPLTDGNVSDAISISSSGSVAAGAVTGTLSDGQVSDALTISSSGSVDPAALSSAVAVSEGGTGASTASGARSNLGAAGVGDCGPGQVVANTTSSGSECVSVDTDSGNELQTLQQVLSEGNQTGGQDIDMEGGSIRSSSGEVCIGDQCT